MSNKIRSKYYTIELYDDSENINFNDKIKLISNYEHVYIKHDKDNCKPHYHVCVSFPNYRYINSICDEFNIPINYIEPIRSLDSILMYLIHFNDKSKFQYSIDEVNGSMKFINKLKKCIKNNELEEEDKIFDLINFIEEQPYLNYSNFIKYACSIGRFDIVRRSQYLFIKLIDEHNMKILD